MPKISDTDVNFRVLCIRQKILLVIGRKIHECGFGNL